MTSEDNELYTHILFVIGFVFLFYFNNLSHLKMYIYNNIRILFITQVYTKLHKLNTNVHETHYKYYAHI